jgi:hypothetical protein
MLLPLLRNLPAFPFLAFRSHQGYHIHERSESPYIVRIAEELLFEAALKLGIIGEVPRAALNYIAVAREVRQDTSPS